MAQKTRESLRKALFAAPKFKTEVVKIFNDQSIELKQPTVGQISELSELTDNEDKNTIIQLLIDFSYVPGTTEKVFDKTDYDDLLNMPSGDWLREFNSAFLDLAGMNTEEAEKN